MTDTGVDSPVERDAPRDVDRPRPAAAVWWARWGRLAAAALVGLVACATSFKLRTVPVPTDPWHYVTAGLTFPADSWNMVGLTRYGMVLPMIPVTRLFQDSELSFYLTPCLASGLLIAAVYWLAARFFGPVAGVAASVLTLANSVVLSYASRMYPDVFAATTTALAVATAVGARDVWTRDGVVRGRLVSLLVLTGTLVGLSWWMRETSVFAWPVVGAVLLWRGGPPRRVTLPAVAVPAAVMLGLEMLVSRLAFGDPMARFEALTGPDLSATTNPADIPYLGQARLDYLLTMPRVALTLADGHWMLAIAALAVVSGLAFPRKVGLFAGWFLLVALLLTAAGGALRPDHPNIRLDVTRYWIAFLPPMVIAAVGGVATVVGLVAARWGRGRVTPARTVLAGLVAVALVAGPVVASAEGVRKSPTFVVTNGNVTAKFRNWLHAHDRQVDRVFSDWESARILPTYARSFAGRPMATATWHSLTGGHVRPGDYVVLFSAYDGTCYFCNENINVWLPQHRKRLRHWHKVWQTPDRTFVVYHVPRRH